MTVRYDLTKEVLVPQRAPMQQPEEISIDDRMGWNIESTYE